mgnify:FL=1
MFLIISNTVISISNSIIYSIINTPIPRGVGIAAVSLYISYYNTFYTRFQVYKINKTIHYFSCILYIDYSRSFVYNKAIVKSGAALKYERST